MTTTYPRDEREVLESPKVQGVNEARAYTFDFTDAGVVTVSSPVAKVYQDGVDVTATVMPTGSASLVGLVLTTPLLRNLEAGQVYLMYGRVTHDGGQQTELFCKVIARA
jgi:hypothetical protein